MRCGGRQFKEALATILTKEIICKNHASLQLISGTIQIIRFYLSLVKSVNVAYGESEVKLSLMRCRGRQFKEALATILTKEIICFGNW
jgi:hypothetical protein